MGLFKRKPEKSQVERLEEAVRTGNYTGAHGVSAMVIRQLDVTPSRFYTTLQEAYRECLAQEDFDRMKLLRETSGVNPDLVRKGTGYYGDNLQDAYIMYAREGKSKELRALVEASGVPMNDTAEVAYLAGIVAANELARMEK